MKTLVVIILLLMPFGMVMFLTHREARWGLPITLAWVTVVLMVAVIVAGAMLLE